MHAPIVTLTMNPALDVSTSVDRVVPDHKLRCATSRFDPGGGGVNVSRAIRNLGGNTLAIYPLGGPTGQAYRGFAEHAGVVGRVIAIAENTRESFTINETSTEKQYRFVLHGPNLQEAEWRACLAAVDEHIPHGGFLVASGSLPPGVPVQFYAMIARLCAARNVRVVLDAAGPSLAAALAEGVFLIKPSRDELAALIGQKGDMPADELRTAAEDIVHDGRAEIVALSLGAGGALLVHATGTLRLPTPHIKVASAVGAGDAFLGAFVLRLAEGRSIEDAFRTAIAAGSATAMRPGSELCGAEDVAQLEQILAAD